MPYVVRRASDADGAGFGRDQVHLWAEQRGAVCPVHRSLRVLWRGKVPAPSKRGGADFGGTVGNPHEHYPGQARIVRHGESSRGERVRREEVTR